MRAAAVAAVALLAACLGAVPAPAAEAVVGHPEAGTSTPAPGRTTARVAATAATAQDFSSIFSGSDAALAGSGWAACPAPIPWTVDTAGLTASQAAEQVASLTWAFDQWSQASGLAFAFGGVEDLAYDDRSFVLTPANGGPAQLHHIYLGFVADADSARLSDATVGLGSPTQVMASSKEIVAGDAVFRTDHVLRAGTKELRSLYLHELGHVLGLAHASATTNVMFPVVRANVTLGAGDVNGVRAMTKSCAD